MSSRRTVGEGRSNYVASMKPFSRACENNKGPILAVLARHLGTVCTILEIGSGTGQHAASFAARFPQAVLLPIDNDRRSASTRATPVTRSWHRIQYQRGSRELAVSVIASGTSGSPRNHSDQAITTGGEAGRSPQPRAPHSERCPQKNPWREPARQSARPRWPGRGR